MINLENISCIIFDLGGVLLDIDYDKTSQAFLKLGFADFDKFYRQDQQTELFSLFETGKFTPKQFRNGVRKLAHSNYTDQQIDEAWCNMLGQFKESVIPLLKRLRFHYKLVLFSNTNQIHYEHAIQSMQEKFGYNILEKLFDSLYLSHKINVRKPDASAFQTVLRLENTQSYETVFIDDTKKHVQGAQTIGIKSYWLKKDKLVTDLFSE